MMFQPLNAKVEAPNYNFSLDTLADFFPGKNRDDLEKKYGKAEVMASSSGTETLKFYVAHIRYKFPVMVQVKEGKVLDFFSKLPNATLSKQKSLVQERESNSISDFFPQNLIECSGSVKLQRER